MKGGFPLKIVSCNPDYIYRLILEYGLPTHSGWMGMYSVRAGCGGRKRGTPLVVERPFLPTVECM